MFCRSKLHMCAFSYPYEKKPISNKMIKIYPNYFYRMVGDILKTRVMVKKAMKLYKGDKVSLSDFSSKDKYISTYVKKIVENRQNYPFF